MGASRRAPPGPVVRGSRKRSGPPNSGTPVTALNRGRHRSIANRHCLEVITPVADAVDFARNGGPRAGRRRLEEAAAVAEVEAGPSSQACGSAEARRTESARAGTTRLNQRWRSSRTRAQRPGRSVPKAGGATGADAGPPTVRCSPPTRAAIPRGASAEIWPRRGTVPPPCRRRSSSPASDLPRRSRPARCGSSRMDTFSQRGQHRFIY